MTKNNTSLEQLKSFLNQLFQFDSQDLDFGVYKILHYKKKEIANFIDQLLVDKVKAELQTLSADEAKQVQDQITEMEKSTSLNKWLEAVEKKDETRLAIYEEDYKDEISEYKELKAKVTESSVSIETENQIYNHLTLFFSRYYDKGDFISKRRFGKNEKYVVPYNGEETHFHWANQDQYYIKSSETFNQYAFKVPSTSGEIIVNFKLTDAQLEQGNVKESDKNYFILSEKKAEINKEDATFFFEYRPLTDKEKKKVKGNSKQDTLDEIAFDFLKKKFSSNPVLANLWKEQDGKPLLLKKLQHYTRKNKHDFFIHKNLKGFLERELDYYIKSELVNVDDLYVTDTDAYFDRLKHNLKTIKVFKSIADTIIAFVSQIENFQKKIWEKKKFVLSTEWVITIDRLVDYVGEEAAKPILEEVLRNEKQIAEWKEMFGDLSKFKKTSDFLSDENLNLIKLPIDTVHYSADFKSLLLGKISVKQNLESLIDGLLIKSDNYPALNIIKPKFEESIASTYIDPPYNTGDDGFIYKDRFKSSTWLTMFEPLLSINRDLLSDKGALFVSCDEHEELSLGQLLNTTYGEINKVEKITWNKRIPKNDKGIGNIHEYIYLYTRNKEYRKSCDLSFVMRKDSLEEVYEIVKKAKSSGKSIKEAQEILKKYYKKQGFDRGITLYCELDKNYEIWGKINMSWPNAKTEGPRYEVINPVTNKPAPIPNKGWRWKEETFRAAERNGEEFILPDGSMMKGRIWYANNEKTQPSSITYLREVESFLLRSIISQKSDGGITLENLSLQEKVDYPKPVKLIEYLLYATSINDGFFLDYFAGSGTTFHAIQNLNNQDDGNRKCLLIEQGNYIYTVILPRIKKIAHSLEWSSGQPQKPIGGGNGVFLKYQRLEQYEEALENIAFNASDDTIQKALVFEQYIPKYFLEFETKGSQTLVNTEAMKDPWNYKLKVWDGFTYDTEQAVDLVETFNYLIGLHMQKCITKELNEKKYQFIYGHNNANKNILVVWRSVKDWNVEDFKADSSSLKTEIKAFEYDLLYINDQAHIEGYQPIEEVFKNKMLS
ncbi:site-specific DNA-methyltransferase [Marixanthomonas ophiurae]|uniref:site-specific DNA-methyltransferase (adenine-specific) n=1 Tax=Marixanthomonas ophiurae TaxID=387659 RepID=A0A3E1Q9K1_9FLAO|nr:site-specific DNA-methyltransferase [Marixanthomonas ophiurae]RFN58816.1 site-specific DNA-methyltransferase [Marixanthomonas ophiurae]